MRCEVKVDYPGLLCERLPSGNSRYRVRVEGNLRKRIVLRTAPGDKDFFEHYLAARRGIEIKPDIGSEDLLVRGSIAWLVRLHLDDLALQVASGLASPHTLKKRTLTLSKIRDEYGEYSIEVPSSKILQIRDSLAHTPAWADSTVEALRTMYRWGQERGHCDTNPAVGIPRIDRGKGGATPWSVADLKQYRDFHPLGTTAHLCLMLLVFTACRIGDATYLGRQNEFERHGIRGLKWQPHKRGSAPVEIPLVPQLYTATRSTSVQGPTYLLTDYGRPFSSPDALGQRFKKWCREAGIKNRSAHGIRKAAGHLLAEAGCSQYQIMAIHGHTQARTSEVYTRGVERWTLAADAMKALASLDL